MKLLARLFIVGRRLSILLAPITVIGCQANAPLPKGFNEACYDNGHIKQSFPVYYAKLNLQSTELPQLNKTLWKLAEKYGLKIYDNSSLVKRSYDNPDGFTMYLCSKDGLFSMVDDRAWLSLPDSSSGSPTELPTAPVLSISVMAYRNDKQWRNFSEVLDSTIRSEWPNRLRVIDPHTLRPIVPRPNKQSQ